MVYCFALGHNAGCAIFCNSHNCNMSQQSRSFNTSLIIKRNSVGSLWAQPQEHLFLCVLDIDTCGWGIVSSLLGQMESIRPPYGDQNFHGAFLSTATIPLSSYLPLRKEHKCILGNCDCLKGSWNPACGHPTPVDLIYFLFWHLPSKGFTDEKREG